MHGPSAPFSILLKFTSNASQSNFKLFAIKMKRKKKAKTNWQVECKLKMQLRENVSLILKTRRNRKKRHCEEFTFKKTKCGCELKSQLMLKTGTEWQIIIIVKHTHNTKFNVRHLGLLFLNHSAFSIYLMPKCHHILFFSCFFLFLGKLYFFYF